MLIGMTSPFVRFADNAPASGGAALPRGSSLKRSLGEGDHEVVEGVRRRMMSRIGP